MSIYGNKKSVGFWSQAGYWGSTLFMRSFNHKAKVRIMFEK